MVCFRLKGGVSKSWLTPLVSKLSSAEGAKKAEFVCFIRHFTPLLVVSDRDRGGRHYQHRDNQTSGATSGGVVSGADYEEVSGQEPQRYRGGGGGGYQQRTKRQQKLADR